MLEEYLNIRYTKLYFVIEFVEDTELVRDKASALRGGMGEMLLRIHCIADRQCEKCSFAEECIVQRIMYSPMVSKPGYMKEGNSVGYILDCSDKKKLYRAGDLMEFELLLFGNSIVHFAEYVSAFAMLGQTGLGKNKSRFQIHEIRNLY